MRFSREWRAALTALVLVIGLAAGSGSARAEEFIKPTYRSLLHTLIRFGALDIRDNDMVDAYAMLQHCDLYTKYFRDDFKWHEMRADFRKAFQKDVATYPTAYAYAATLKLDRYDFKNKFYPFTEGSAPKGANVFRFSAEGDAQCGEEAITIFPTEYLIVLEEPLTILGLPLREDDAKKLMYRLDAVGNTTHIIFSRFNMRITAVPRLERKVLANKKKEGPFTQPNRGRDRSVALRARLESAEFFEDEAMKKLIYVYQP